MHNALEDIGIVYHRHGVLLPRLGEPSQAPMRVVTLHIGDLHASKSPVKIKTILGSCIAACLFDPSTGIGGMNHFLLPGTADDPDLSTRYGINAMEVLINEMMKLGANRNSLQAKIFGGGDIFRANHKMMMIGEKNIRFVTDFLETESIPIITRRIGGRQGIVVVYLPHSFDVFIKPMSMERFWATEETELSYRERLTHELALPREGSITLF